VQLDRHELESIIYCTRLQCESKQNRKRPESGWERGGGGEREKPSGKEITAAGWFVAEKEYEERRKTCV